MVIQISHEELLLCSLFFLNGSSGELYSSEKSFESWKGQLCSEESVPKWSYISYTVYSFLVIEGSSCMSRFFKASKDAM